jgi:DNA-binding beta-propeller fold protein YncE
MDEAVDHIVRARLFCLYSGFHSAVTGQVYLDEPDESTSKVNYTIQYSVPDAVALSSSAGAAHSPTVIGARAGLTPTLVYASDITDSAIQVINPDSAATVTTIQLPAGDTPVGIAPTPDGRFAWVVDAGATGPPATAGSIQIIDTSSNQITGSIKLSSQVHASWIAMAPDGKTAYVTNEGEYLVGVNNTEGAVNSVLIIDVPSRTVTGQIASPLRNPQLPNAGHAHFEHLAVSPDGTMLYVAAPGLGYFVFDTLTSTQVYPPPSYAFGVVNFFDPQVYAAPGTTLIFHPNGTRVYYYTLNCPRSTPGRTCLVAIDTKTHTAAQWTALQAVSANDTLAGLGLTPDGRTAWVKEFNSGDFIPVDTSTFTTGKRLAGPRFTSAVFTRLPPQ